MAKLIFDDIVTDPNGHRWTQVCEKHSKMTDENLDDCGSGICGVEGCDVESDYYLDFK